ncbi:MAG TPA: site-specific integrase [Candidatus Limnocylindria bacterium]|nr:site-specific integrase [Candidatus Limnocylindria bacterium]
MVGGSGPALGNAPETLTLASGRWQASRGLYSPVHDARGCRVDRVNDEKHNRDQLPPRQSSEELNDTQHRRLHIWSLALRWRPPYHSELRGAVYDQTGWRRGHDSLTPSDPRRGFGRLAVVVERNLQPAGNRPSSSSGRTIAIPSGAPTASSPAPTRSPTFLRSGRTNLRPLLKAAGLPLIRFHDLRHTAATLMLSAGVNPKIASEMLGHASVAFTLDRYSHVIPTMQEDAARRMDALLGTGA